MSHNLEAYNRWSEFYDHAKNPTVAIDEITFPPAWSHWQKKTILEIGSGTGRHTGKLLKKRNLVVAVEPSAGMMRVAKSKWGEHSVQWIEKDFFRAEELKPRAFDGVLISLVLEHIENLPAFFARVSSVLSLGGEVHLSEIHPVRAAKGSTAHFRDPNTQEEIRLKSFVHSVESIEKSNGRRKFNADKSTNYRRGRNFLSAQCGLGSIPRTANDSTLALGQELANCLYRQTCSA